MRKILFRAKRKNWRKLPKEEWWVEGYPVKYQPCASKDEYVYGICPTYASALYIIEIDPETLCQFTGFTDKHGQRIWENDIVEFEDVGEEGYEYEEGFDFTNTATVVWHNGRFEMSDFASSNSAVLEEMNNCHEDFILVFQECEVIGNVFDDKHLLNETDYCREQEKEMED